MLCSLWMWWLLWNLKLYSLANDAFNCKTLTLVLVSVNSLRQKAKNLFSSNINNHIFLFYQYFQRKEDNPTIWIMSSLSPVTKSENFMEDITSLQETWKKKIRIWEEKCCQSKHPPFLLLPHNLYTEYDVIWCGILVTWGQMSQLCLLSTSCALPAPSPVWQY